MNRREFLKAGAAGLAAGILTPHVAAAADDKALRAGLIGTGWYGKNDMFRLIQVAKPNIEVVSLCDVDRRQLERASELNAAVVVCLIATLYPSRQAAKLDPAQALRYE